MPDGGPLAHCPGQGALGGGPVARGPGAVADGPWAWAGCEHQLPSNRVRHGYHLGMVPDAIAIHPIRTTTNIKLKSANKWCRRALTHNLFTCHSVQPCCPGWVFPLWVVGAAPLQGPPSGAGEVWDG